jgi:hypothetical protein
MVKTITLGSLVLLILVGALPVFCSQTGSISGTVTDPGGGVVSGATVVATETNTSLHFSTLTNPDGFYSFPSLPIGSYQVEVQFAGFKRYLRKDLLLNVDTALRVDARLEIGAPTQEITVLENSVHPETESTQAGEVINGAKMTAVPLNGRSYTDLLALQPGVIPLSTNEYTSVVGQPAPSGSLNAGNLSISGQREASNSFMVNGGNVEETFSNGTAVIPNLDSIAEFRILTNSTEAEYGHYNGGIINVVTKSGGNEFHGNVFEFLRNTDLDAKNFYSSSRGTFNQNQYGGTFGGPVKREKIFFFADYQGTGLTEGIDLGDIAVPSIQERQGNFSSVANELTGTVSSTYFANLLSQELGYPVASGEPYYVAGCTSPSKCVFPNAVIPQSAISSPASHMLPYIPMPNTSGGYFSTSSANETLNDNKGALRLDGNSPLGLLSAYYFIDDFHLVNPYPAATVPGFGAGSFGRAQQILLSDNKTFSSSVFNAITLNYMRNAIYFGAPTTSGPTLSSLGFVTGPNTPGIVPLAPTIQGVPETSFNSFVIGLDPFTDNVYENNFQVVDNFTLVRGTHTISLGGDYEYFQSNYHEQGLRNGQFSFNGVQTGLDFADFLIGAPSFYAQFQNQPFYARSWSSGLYAQDSWRIKSSLTLNYGLRWEVNSPWSAKYNQLISFVPGEQSKVFPGAPTGLVFPGDPGVPATIAPIRWGDFAPRIGLAYSPNVSGDGLLANVLGGPGKTSIRASWGIYYTSYDNAENLTVNGAPPFGYFFAAPTPPLFATPFIGQSGVNFGQRYPVPFAPLSTSPSNPDSSVNWPQFLPVSGQPIYSTNDRPAYAEQYMLSLQRQFGGNTLLTVSYVGSEGHHLMASLLADPGIPALCLSVSQPSQVLPGTPTCGPFGEGGTYYPINGPPINSTRQYGSNFNGLVYFASVANSNYNALEITVHQTSGRLQWLAGYTFGKSLDNSSGWGAGGQALNPVDYNQSRGLSTFQIAQNFVASYSYELPFDKLFASNRATRGWQVSGITHFATGQPILITDPSDASLLGGTVWGVFDTPDFKPGPLNFTNPRSGKPYFNTSLFSPEPLGQLGTANERFITGPGLNNWDMAILKSVPFTESKILQIRFELFNTFNHAQFENPSGNYLSSTFGLVTAARAARIGQVGFKFNF